MIWLDCWKNIWEKFRFSFGIGCWIHWAIVLYFEIQWDLEMPKIIFFFQVNSKNSKESILKNLTFRSWRRIFFNRYCRINFLHFSTFFSDIQNHLIFRSAFFSQPFTPWSLHEFQKPDWWLYNSKGISLLSAFLTKFTGQVFLCVRSSYFTMCQWIRW